MLSLESLTETWVRLVQQSYTAAAGVSQIEMASILPPQLAMSWMALALSTLDQ